MEAEYKRQIRKRVAQMKSNLLARVGDIVAAHVASNRVAANDVADLITSVYGALDRLGTPPVKAVEALSPAVSVRSSVKPDAITCLICGRTFKSLRRHIGGHGLTESGYREMWSLSDDYPMTAPDYSAKRSAMAKALGLGGRKRKVVEAAPAPKARKRLGVKV